MHAAKAQERVEEWQVMYAEARAEIERLRELLELAHAAACNDYAAFTKQGKWDWAIHDVYRQRRDTLTPTDATTQGAP